MTPLSLRQRARRPIWAFIGLILFAASDGRAQDYPNRTVTIVAPSAPGGTADRQQARATLWPIVRGREPAGREFDHRRGLRRACATTLMTAASTTMATNVSLQKNLPTRAFRLSNAVHSRPKVVSLLQILGGPQPVTLAQRDIEAIIS
jgi:hypothetical protein